MSIWYLSFATDEDGFMGGVYTEADDMEAAVIKCHTLGINPGGEVLGFEAPPTIPLKPEYMDRLLDRAGVEAAVGDKPGTSKKLKELTEDERIAILGDDPICAYRMATGATPSRELTEEEIEVMKINPYSILRDETDRILAVGGSCPGLDQDLRGLAKELAAERLAAQPPQPPAPKDTDGPAPAPSPTVR